MGSAKTAEVEIHDIHDGKLDGSLLDMMLNSLNPEAGEIRRLPTLLLYDEQGLKLFEKITYLNEYYLTNQEIEALTAHADKIVERIEAGSQLLELGSGNLRKVDILLQAFERAQKNITYFALDLNLAELKRTFAEISPDSYKYVKCAGLHGTYDDALEWLSKPENKQVPTCVMSLGSSIGNFGPIAAAEFLKGFALVLNKYDSMIIGLDACEDGDRIYHAYNDSENVTHSFYRNGLEHANRLLGAELFQQDKWDVRGKYNKDLHRHEAQYTALEDVTVKGISFKKGECLKMEEAHKYTTRQSDDLWRHAGLIRNLSFGNKRNDYFLHFLTPFGINYRTDPESYASQPVPNVEDWTELWNAWDTVTRVMVPAANLLTKPIELRNNLIFYLGHIPTFADIHITRATGEAPTKPAYFQTIFERGIDPDVDDPTHCHDHSEIPDTWPTLEEILVFENRVRVRTKRLITSGEVKNNRKLGRALWLAFEHEVMHLETFLYMVLQSEEVLAPPTTPTPDFAAIHRKAEHDSVTNKWFVIPATKVNFGLDDPENDDGPDRHFGWDNERPIRSVDVPAFEAQARPITNGDYAHFLEQNGAKALPASWIIKTPELHASDSTANGHQARSSRVSDAFIQGKAVRTIFGHVPLKYALTWPVMASYDELAAYATWMKGRIPTMEEARSIYNYVEELKKESAQKTSSKLVPAVNGHLLNEGVEETPPHSNGINNLPNGEHTILVPDPKDNFIDLKDCPVGLKYWHPVPVTPNGDRLGGQSDFGGVWEWTSSTLERFEGFRPMDLYPGYTADFFDGKHNIMLGGSWATHPRVAGRKSFVNWYQRNYPFAWAGARLVRDVSN